MERIDVKNINNDEVHIWLAEHPKWNKTELVCFLDATEAKKLQKIRHPRRQSEFIVGRYLLKKLLESYTGIDINKVKITASKGGKPYLDLDTGSAPIFFNLSHSGPYIAFVFDSEGEVGIDIEYRKMFTLDQNCDRPSKPLAYTLKRWTEKEATLKRIGIGLKQSDEELSDDAQLLSFEQDRYVLTVAARKSAKNIRFKGMIHE